MTILKFEKIIEDRDMHERIVNGLNKYKAAMVCGSNNSCVVLLFDDANGVGEGFVCLIRYNEWAIMISIKLYKKGIV